MRDKLIKLLKQAKKQQSLNAVCGDIDSLIDSPKGAEFIADYLLANGGVVIPCKVGDKIYQTDFVRLYESTINEMTFTANKTIYVTENVVFDERAIGKTVFLTREEAERALKGGEG